VLKSQFQVDAECLASYPFPLLKELNGEIKERKLLKMLGKNYLDAERDAPLLIELLSELDAPPHSAAAGRQ
jgi:hypothetical protein